MMVGRYLALAIALLFGAGAATAQGVTIPVRIEAPAPQSGRLLIFAQRVAPDAPATPSIDTSPFQPTETVVIGREVGAFAPGATVTVDAETDAFPRGLSTLEPGRWRIQAVLDRNGDYNYGGRGAGDMVSEVVETTLPGPVPALLLNRTLPATDVDAIVERFPESERAPTRAALAKLEPIDFVSSRLTAFWGRPVAMRGWLALPPGYRSDARTTYPVVYWTHGFGGDIVSSRLEAASRARRMASGELPPMIWVMLDQSSATGTHEFADSVNNGPWGAALTAELIPMLERRYRMDARATGRFVTGHSSGGWASLWLQVRYPEVFGGTWSTSPDPSDFHDFTGVDIYRADANAFTDAAGEPTPLVRDEGRVLASFQDFARLEEAIGPVGGQLASIEWVFSPRGPDGRPMPLFDRLTGNIDPLVATYWRDHYDIAHIVERDWARLRPLLDGKLRVIVGEADTFYLDRAARRLQAVMERLGARAQFTYVPGGTHFNLYQGGGLTQRIAREMYAIARPGNDWAPRAAGDPRR